MDEAAYVAQARTRIRKILDTEHAVVRPELMARISEAYFPNSAGLNIDPHHVGTALSELAAHQEIVWTDPKASRGLHPVQTIQPANQHKRKTEINTAAARKRLLYGRYLGWAHGTKRHPNGLIGPAGEQAVRTGLLQSQAFVPWQPDAGEVKNLFDVKLPGSLDSAGITVPLINGIPEGPITVLVEVKNTRGWIYPHSEEPYQLLHKACVLQQAQPDQAILPVLVCRKAHFTCYPMARQLGFMVIDLAAQFAGDLDEKSLNEVRNELHFRDLYAGTGPSLRVRDRFQNVVRQHASAYAATWRRTGVDPELAHFIHQLRDIGGADRTSLMAAFREYLTEAGYHVSF